MVKLEFVNEVYLKVVSSRSILLEMSEYFTFRIENAHFNPKVKAKVWDGNIRLLNLNTGEIYLGLVYHIQKFCEDRNYPIEIDDKIFKGDDISDEFPLKFSKFLDAPFEPWEHQAEAVREIIRRGRALLLCPTNSGKSFIIYLIAMYNMLKHNRKTLIIVDTNILANQMVNDIISYSNGNDVDVAIVTGDYAAKLDHIPDISIGTWQGLHRKPISFFENFGVIIGDEAHVFTANSLKAIMEKCVSQSVKVGTTGTIDDTKTHKLTLQGLFGPILKVSSNRELIDQGVSSNVLIKILILKHKVETRKLMRKDGAKISYDDEIKLIIGNEDRNMFLTNLANSIEGNNLTLVRYIENHAKPLFELFKEKLRNPRLVYGKTNDVDRQEVIRLFESDDNVNALASIRLFSTGVNVKKLHNIIMAHPMKGKIKLLQTIGRGLRLHETKTHMTLYDIADDLRSGSLINHTYQHLEKRIEIYEKEGFKYKIYEIEL